MHLPKPAIRSALRRGFHTLRCMVAPFHLGTAERNIWILYIEILWAYFLVAAMTFNAPYALRLGATNAEIGLLTSLPALLALVVTIPAGQFLARRARRLPLILWNLLAYRIGYLLIIFIPLLPLAFKGQALVWTLVAFSTPAHFFNAGWSAVLADLIPEARRARVFAIRNVIAALVSTVVIFAAGQWLEHGRFPINYQLLYAIGALASFVGIVYMFQLRVPDSAPSTAATQPITSGSILRNARDMFLHQPDFRRIVVNTFAHAAGMWMIAPLYVLYYVRTLGAAEGWIGLNNMLANLSPVLGFFLWQRAIARWGENRVLKLTISIVGIYPILVGLSPGLTPILFWTALNGLITPGVTLSHFNMLLKVTPQAERPMYISVYTAIMNGGTFVMPLIGVLLAGLFGFAPVLIAGGILCLIGSSSFRIRSLQTPDSLAVRLE